MDPEEATNPEADAPEEVADEANAQGEDQVTAEQAAEGDEPEGQAEDDSEEIDLDGVKYKVPKAVVPQIMKNADYTRKTQEIAEIRKAAEAQKAAVAEREAAIPTLIAEHAAIHTLEQQLKQYDEYNWQAAEIEASRIEDEQERAATLATLRAHERAYNALPRQIAAAKDGLSKKESERLEEQRATSAKALQETGAVLSRDIPGWGPELANKLVETATKSFGVSMEDLAELTDARYWKILHAAHEGLQLKAKQKTVQTIQNQVKVTPAVKTKGGSFSGEGVHDNLPTAEWMRREAARVAKLRAG